MIIIQLSALRVGDNIVLSFTKVMDRFELRNDDITDTKLIETDRNYWINRSTQKNIELVDKLLEIINEKADPNFKLNYNKHYIGLTDGMKSRNFIHFKPKRQFISVMVEAENADECISKLEDVGISSNTVERWARFYLTSQIFEKNKGLITEIIQSAVELFNKE